jgi:hypothetical protein
VAGAALSSALNIGMIDIGEPLQFEVFFLTAEGAVLSVLGTRIYRWAQRRRQRC